MKMMTKFVKSEPSPPKDPVFSHNVMSCERHRIAQNGLNDRVSDMELAKCKAELLGLRLQQWNLLDDSVRIYVFRSLQKDVAKFFEMEGNFLACNDFGGMVAALYINHSPEEWRLFIDSTKLSLKAVLLHNGNMLPSNSSWPCGQYEGDI
jgi:hypothetical protein